MKIVVIGGSGLIGSKLGGLREIERQTRRRRREECRRVSHRAAIGGLPPQPGILDDVLGSTALPSMR